MKIFFAGLLSLSLLAPITIMAQEPTPEQLDEARKAFEQGQNAYNQGDYAFALGLYKKAYQLAKKPTILFNIGQCHRKLNEFQEAAINYKKFIQEDPNTQYLGEVEYKLAEIAEQLGNKQEALDYYEKYLTHRVADDPNEAKANERITALKAELNPKGPNVVPTDPPKAKKPLLSYALFGAAVAATPGIVFFGRKAQDIEAKCADGDFDDKDELTDFGCPNSLLLRPALTSDAFLVASLASAGVGVALFVKAKKATTETASKKSNTALRLIPTTTGGFVTFSFTPNP